MNKCPVKGLSNSSHGRQSESCVEGRERVDLAPHDGLSQADEGGIVLQRVFRTPYGHVADDGGLRGDDSGGGGEFAGRGNNDATFTK